MYYNYLGKQDIEIDMLVYDKRWSVAHVFEQIHPNGYGHKEKYAFIQRTWDFCVELSIYKFNGESYMPKTTIPFDILEDLSKHRDLFH